MKILLSAVSCNPVWGSEPHFGWTSALALAREHDVWVITHGHHRPEIEAARARGEVPAHLTFHYHGEDGSRRRDPILARLQNWLGYRRWTRSVEAVARQLHAEIGFDLIHHVTVSTWRVASPLWKLGVPFVWGPIGGAEVFPRQLYGILSPRSRAYEAFRSALNLLGRHQPAIRRCAREAAHIFVSNAEARALLTTLRGSESGISTLSPAFFLETERATTPRDYDAPLHLFAGGGLEGRKGFALALRGLAAARAKGFRGTYTIGGGGPELTHLQTLVEQLGLTDIVRLGVYLRGEEYTAELKATHIYLLPSLRDSAGITLMEAMRAGCVPIVAACGGPGEIVTEDCGIRLSPARPEEMTHAIADALLRLDRDRALLHQLSLAATERINAHYSAAHYISRVNAVYHTNSLNKADSRF